MKTIPVCLLIAGMLVPAICSAQPPGPRDGPRGGKPKPGDDHRRPFAEAWKNADANRDGVISLEEFHGIERIQVLPEEQREKIFKRLDKDGDGNLGRDELMRATRSPDSPMRKRLWELDLDRSGGISIEEFRQGHLFKKLKPDRMIEVFNHLDTDQDGLITPRDRPEPSFRKGEGKPRPKGKKGAKEGEGKSPKEAGDPDRLRKMIRKLDTGGDGRLSFDEFRVGPGIKGLDEDSQEDRFNQLDRNGDLEISKEDALAAPAKRKD